MKTIIKDIKDNIVGVLGFLFIVAIVVGVVINIFTEKTPTEVRVELEQELGDMFAVCEKYTPFTFESYYDLRDWYGQGYNDFNATALQNQYEIERALWRTKKLGLCKRWYEHKYEYYPL